MSRAIITGTVLVITLSLLSRTSHPKFDTGPTAHDISVHLTQRLALDAVFWTSPVLDRTFFAAAGFLKRALGELLFVAEAPLSSALCKRPPPPRLCAVSVC
jgi:hypothetical protein